MCLYGEVIIVENSILFILWLEITNNALVEQSLPTIILFERMTEEAWEEKVILMEEKNYSGLTYNISI